MADNNPDPIVVTITAQIKSLMDGLTSATSGVKAATSEMSSSFNGLTSIINNLKTPFLALTALLAGGSMFKTAVKDTIDWTMKVHELSESMALNMQQASTWAVMLQTLGISGDTMAGAMQRLQIRVTAGAKLFAAYGIATREANGAMLPTGTIMEGIIAKYASLGTQSEKNAMLAALFGRSWMSIQPIMRATADRMAEATQTAKDLGLEVGENGVAKARAYTEALNGVKLIVLALGNAVGQSLLPILTSLSTWFKTTGPGSASVLGVALKSLASVFYGLWADISDVCTLINVALFSIWETLSKVVKATYLAATGDFRGAWEAIKDGWQNINNVGVAGGNQMAATQKALAASLKAVWADVKLGPEEKGGSTQPPPGGGSANQAQAKADPGKDATAAYMQEFQRGLETKKNLEENWFSWSVAREIRYWQEKLDCTVQGSKLAQGIELEIGKLQRKQAEQGESEQKAEFARRYAMIQQGSQERIAAAVEEANRLRGVYGANSNEYRASLSEIVKAEQDARAQIETAERDHLAQMRELDDAIIDGKRTNALEALDFELQAAQENEANGLISKQRLLAAERKYENERYQIELKAARDKARLEKDPVEQQKDLNKIESLERAHNARLSSLTRQSAAQQRATYDHLFQGMTSGFGQAISGMINGTMTWGQAWRSVLSGMLDFLVQTSINMLMKWVADRLYEMIFGKVTRTADITGASSVYAVNAMASVAAIPVTGWAMAPGVGAAALALGLSYIASAAGGWERVPVNTMAALHKDEQVLPANYAQGLRNLVASGGTGGDTHVHASFNGVVDAKTFFQNNQGHIVSTIRGAIGNRRG